jgi:hypothetical protein
MPQRWNSVSHSNFHNADSGSIPSDDLNVIMTYPVTIIICLHLAPKHKRPSGQQCPGPKQLRVVMLITSVMLH